MEKGRVASIAKLALKNGSLLRDEAVMGGFVTEEEFDKFFHPEEHRDNVPWRG